MLLNCTTGMIMGLLTISLVLTDMLYSHADRSVFHLFFGSTVTVLLFVLCKYGYELVNWGLLGLSFLFIVMCMVYVQMNSRDDTCDVCGRPRRTCGCRKDPCHICGVPRHTCGCRKNSCDVCKKPKPKCKCNRNKRM